MAAPSADAALRAMLETALRNGSWDAASISVLGPGGILEQAAFSDPMAWAADRLQFEVGEGPCLDAVQPEWGEQGKERLVVAADLTAELRWPRWAPAATAQGIRAAVAFRLFTANTLGSIALYARHSGGFDRSSLDELQIVAALASVVVTQVRTQRDLSRAVQSRGQIGQAQGMLMHRHGLTADSAFAVLRRLSQHHNTKLAALAEAIVTTGELPDDIQTSPFHTENPEMADPKAQGTR